MNNKFINEKSSQLEKLRQLTKNISNNKYQLSMRILIRDEVIYIDMQLLSIDIFGYVTSFR